MDSVHIKCGCVSSTECSRRLAAPDPYGAQLRGNNWLWEASQMVQESSRRLFEILRILTECYQQIPSRRLGLVMAKNRANTLYYIHNLRIDLVRNLSQERRFWYTDFARSNGV